MSYPLLQVSSGRDARYATGRAVRRVLAAGADSRSAARSHVVAVPCREISASLSTDRYVSNGIARLSIADVMSGSGAGAAPERRARAVARRSSRRRRSSTATLVAVTSVCAAEGLGQRRRAPARRYRTRPSCAASASRPTPVRCRRSRCGRDVGTTTPRQGTPQRP